MTNTPTFHYGAFLEIEDFVDLRIESYEERPDGFYFYVYNCNTHENCIYCLSEKIINYGYKNQIYLDIPVNGRPAYLYIKRIRLFCNNCHKSFFIPIIDFDSKRRTTKRLYKYIWLSSFKQTYSSIAKTLYINDNTVRHIFYDIIKHYETAITFETPTHIGIYKHTLIGKPRYIICNIPYNTIINILPNTSEDLLAKYLTSINTNNKINIISTNCENNILLLLQKLHYRCKTRNLNSTINIKEYLSIAQKKTRGYSFDIMRAYILLHAGIHRVTLKGKKPLIPINSDYTSFTKLDEQSAVYIKHGVFITTQYRIFIDTP